MSTSTPALTEAEFNVIQARFPSSFAGKRPSDVPLSDIVHSVRALTEADVAVAQAHVESGDSLGIRTPDVKTLRHTHHRLAQLLAGGMNDVVAAQVCGYNVGRVAHLRRDPAFAELLAHYAGTVEDAFGDFVETTAALSMDVLQRLQQILDEDPEKLSPGTLIRMYEVLADRSGNAPVNRTMNTNVNVNLGDRLRDARQRANSLLIDQSDGG